MLRLLLRLSPASLLHELGTGRALDNARREHVEVAETMAIVDALVGRIDAAGAHDVGGAGVVRLAAA